MMIACRSAREPLVPTATTGYWCFVCAEPLQITAAGQRRIIEATADPVVIVCNACALRILQLSEHDGPNEVAIEVSPIAQAQITDGRQLSSAGHALADWVRKNKGRRA
jgi:hypothetical protein